MVTVTTLVGPNGQPLAAPAPPKARALGGWANTPYDAASYRNPHTEGWQPYLWSPDGELNIYRDRIVSRVRDLVRNDGWASGAVTRTLDNVIGANFRPIFKPDYRALAAFSGAAFDAVWADEFAKELGSYWRLWAHDDGRWSDTQRNMTFAQMMRLAFRHKVVDGDALAMLHWRPERVGQGRAYFATSVQIIDPDRLSNPQMQFDQQSMRGGVIVDHDGVATGYWIRRAHQGDWFAAGDAVHWDEIPRETAWGRPIIVHDFDHDRGAQHRGGAGMLTPVVQRLKMLAKYDETELDAAIVNAIFGAYVESPFDPSMVEDAMGTSVADSNPLNLYQDSRANFHSNGKILAGGVRVPILFPGERINTVTAARPTANFKEFEGAVLRNFAAGTGLSAQQVSNNWSDVNYSSARGALLEAWKTLGRRRIDFAHGFAQPIAGALIEEIMDTADLPLPAGAPDFLDCRSAYSRAQWIGPGRGWIDPVHEKEGAILGMDAGLSTLEAEAAEQGMDWEETLDQRAVEIKAFKDRGLEPPSWAQLNQVPAQQTITPPTAE